jgi:hypothetical protein
MPMTRMRVAAIAVFLLVLLEWALFELVRMPYNPPRDMLTFLGQEKYGVMMLMGFLGISGSGALACWMLTSNLTRQDYVRLTILLGILMASFGLVALFPPWPVTPFELLFM